MKILLTGAAGQLGQALLAALDGHEVIAVDIEDLDITGLGSVQGALAKFKPELVMNAAAYTDVDGAEANVEPAYRANALGARNLALATAASSCPLLHVSTDYVFDGTSRRPYHEYDLPRPLSVYGASKLAGEEAVRLANPRHYVVRTAWLYHSSGKNFPKTVLELARKQEELRVVNDQHGSPTYAPHLARAIAKLIETGAYGTYHLAGSGGSTWFELTRALFDRMGIGNQVVPVSTAEFPRPAPRPRYAVLATIQDPPILLPPWEEGLAEFARAVGG